MGNLNSCIQEFELNLNHLGSLQFALRYLKNKEKQLQRELETLSKIPQSLYFGMTIEEHYKRLSEAYVIAEIVLLRRAVEHYTAGVHEGHDWSGQSDIKIRCPNYVIKYHSDFPEVHVIDLSYELRNFIVHPLMGEYEHIQASELSPMTILEQNVVLMSDRDNGRRMLVFQNDMSKPDFLKMLSEISFPQEHSRFDLFSGILFDEVRNCVVTYDKVRKMPIEKAIQKSNSLNSKIEYKQDEALSSDGGMTK